MTLKPLAPERWNFSTAAHLLARAGFGGPPAEIDALARRSLEEAIGGLMEEPSVGSTLNLDWAKPDLERAEKLRALRQATGAERQRLQQQRNREQRERLRELQYAWLQRMASGVHPTREKVTLFWHGHFATSMQKVRDAYLMWRQNDLFRRLGLGDWRALLGEVTRDPAMLLWLDQAQSKPDRPNENYPRELLELFTLGEGNYTEEDVMQAARAMSGLTLNRLTQQPETRPRLKVAGPKTVLGRTGDLSVDDVLDTIVQQPAADRFITGKLWHFFAGTAPTAELNEALAAEFRRGDRQIRPLLQVLFRAEAFYAPEVVRQQIKSPVALLVMACRQLERPLPSASLSLGALRLLGQELLVPPSVKGWDGGIAWINTNTLLNRHNLASLVVTGQNALPLGRRKPGPGSARSNDPNVRRMGGADPDRLFDAADRADAQKLLLAVERRFLNAPLRSRERQALLDYLAAQGQLDDQDLLGLVRLTLCTPDYQLT